MATDHQVWVRFLQDRPRKDIMFKVYWTDLEGRSMGKEFEDMNEALRFTQMLRNDYNRKFVTMVSEIADNVTKMGVSETLPGYDWKKRRI